MIRRPPRSTRTDTLFPYTTLFRSVYCQTAQELSQRVRLDGQTRFLCADALHLPFSAAAFDLVWTQHAAMNIADKARLYREVARVLKPGGRFGLYDIMAGPDRKSTRLNSSH